LTILRLSAAELAFIAVALMAAAIASFALTPVAIRIASRTGAIDEPDSGRRVHRTPIPRAGGLAVATAFIVVGLIAWWIADTSGTFRRWPNAILPGQRVDIPQMAGLMGGVALGALFGFIDDRFQIRARWQLLEQVILAGIAIAGAITISTVVNPLQFLGSALGVQSIDLSAEPLSWLATALWIIGMINSINFIDGLDGLSTGVSLIAALTLGVISVTGIAANVEPMVGLLCGVLAGALAGFLPWNFHPARVFIGTTGVYAVGFALAVLSILGTAKIAVALLVLGVPIIDTFWIIVRRMSHGKSPFTPDRGHFHHRLLDLGLTHRRAVLLIYLLCGVLAVASIVISETAGAIYTFLGIVAAFGLVLYLFSRRAQEALDARSYDDQPGDTGVEVPATASDQGSPSSQPEAGDPHGAGRPS
jgi:UDP-GlcNAc:undecaprenyl-phosphate/decaprenyl-phosphate GlcNAc-1-phosphate transferase